MSATMEPIYLKRERKLSGFIVSKTRDWDNHGIEGLRFKDRHGNIYFAYFPYRLIGDLPISTPNIEEEVELPEIGLHGKITTKYFKGDFKGKPLYIKYI